MAQKRVDKVLSHIGTATHLGTVVGVDERVDRRPILRDYDIQLPGPQDDTSRYPDSEAVGRAYAESFLDRSNHNFMYEWWLQYGQGGNMQYYTLNREAQPQKEVVVTNVEDLKRILRYEVQKPWFYEVSLLGQGVLSQSNLDQWEDQRAKLKSAFSLQALRKLQPLMNDSAKELADKFGAAGTLDAMSEISHTTFKVIGEAALGQSPEFLSERAPALRKAFDDTLTYMIVPGHEKLAAAQHEMDEFSREVFDHVEKCPVGGDSSPFLIDRLMAKDSQGCPVYPAGLRHDELITFQFAGHETTANTLCWTLYELSRHLDFQRKLQAEIDTQVAALATKGRTLATMEYGDLGAFTYLTKVLNETLRLWPVVANGSFRHLQQDEWVTGPNGTKVTIPAGAVISTYHFIVHRNPEYWGEDCNEYNPDRPWNNDAFIPFTRPPRDCLGRNLAMQEMRTIMIHLYSRYTVTLVEGAEDRLRAKGGYNLGTLRPRGRGRMQVIATPR